jgi:hypothetical protein
MGAFIVSLQLWRMDLIGWVGLKRARRADGSVMWMDEVVFDRSFFDEVKIAMETKQKDAAYVPIKIC